MEGDNLASAYVTILPDMDRFVEELATDLQAAVDSQHPTVTVNANVQLDQAQLKEAVAQAKSELESVKDVDVAIKADSSSASAAVGRTETSLGTLPSKIAIDITGHMAGLSNAVTRSLNALAPLRDPVVVKIGGDISDLQAKIAEAKLELGTLGDVSVRFGGTGGGGGAEGLGAVTATLGGALSAATVATIASDALTRLNPAVANSAGFKMFMGRVLASMGAVDKQTEGGLVHVGMPGVTEAATSGLLNKLITAHPTIEDINPQMMLGGGAAGAGPSGISWDLLAKSIVQNSNLGGMASALAQHIDLVEQGLMPPISQEGLSKLSGAKNAAGAAMTLADYGIDPETLKVIADAGAAAAAEAQDRAIASAGSAFGVGPGSFNADQRRWLPTGAPSLGGQSGIAPDMLRVIADTQAATDAVDALAKKLAPIGTLLGVTQGGQVNPLAQLLGTAGGEVGNRVPAFPGLSTSLADMAALTQKAAAGINIPVRFNTSAMLPDLVAAEAAARASSKDFIIPAKFDIDKADPALQAALGNLGASAKRAVAANIIQAVTEGNVKQAVPFSVLQQLAGIQTHGGAMTYAASQGLADYAGGGKGPGLLATILPALFGAGTGKGGSGTAAGSLFWGGGSNIPFLGGLAAAGSLGSLAGFGPEHVITTGIGLAGSAVGAGIGAGLLGIGAAGVTGVGAATDLAGVGQALGDAKKTYTAQQALSTAQTQYGVQSSQALTAQLALNQALSQFSPVAQGAVSAVATMANTLHGLFNQATGQAEKMGAQILLSFENVAAQFIPTIGKFATINTGIIKQALMPLESWLGSEKGGLGIFTSLEQIFTQRLPAAMKAFTNGLEFVIKAVGYLGQYGGNLMDYLAKKMEFLNSPKGFAEFEKFAAAMIHDFEVWKGFVEILVKDLYQLFKLDAGLGTGIIASLTTMLEKLHAYLTSANGAAAIRSVFQAHKQQVLELLQLIPPLVRAFEPILHIMPTLTLLTLPFITALVDLLNVLERLPGGIGATISAFLGFSLLLGHIIGYGKVLPFLVDFFTGIGGAIGKAGSALATFIGGMDGAAIATTVLKAALVGIGLVALLVILDEINKHFGTLAAAITLVGVAMAALSFAGIRAKVLGFFSSIGTAATSYTAKTAASAAATTGAVEASAAKISETMTAVGADINTTINGVAADLKVAMAGATESAVTGAEAVAAAWSQAGVDALGAESTMVRGMTVIDAASLETVARIEAISAAWTQAGAASLVAAGEMGAGSVLPDLRAVAPELGLVGAGGGATALGVGFTGLGAAAAVALAPIALVAAGVWGVNTAINALGVAPDPFAKLAASAGNMKAQTGASIASLKSGIISGLEGPGSFFVEPSNLYSGTNLSNSQFAAQTQKILSTVAGTKALIAAASDQGQSSLVNSLKPLLNYQSNLQWLSDHFHITQQQAEQLAQSINLNLGNALGGAGSANVMRFGAALQTMGLNSSGAAQAMSQLAKSSNLTLAQITTGTAQAASAMQSTLSSYSNLASGISSTASTAASAVQGTAQQVTQFYQTQTTNLGAFMTGINAALKEGFSPAVVQQIMTLGPAQGMQALQGILQGATGASGAAFVKQFNAFNTQLSLQSAAAIEQAQLINTVVNLQQHGATKQAATGAQDVGAGVSIFMNEMANSWKGVSASFANSFAGGAPAITAAANALGLVLPKVITASGKQVSLAAFGVQQDYLKALAAAKTPAQLAALGAASALPTAVAGQTGATTTAVNKLIKTANDALTAGKTTSDKAAAGPASSLPDGLKAATGAVGAAALTHVNTLASTILNGKTLVGTQATSTSKVLPTALASAVPSTKTAATSHLSALVSVFTSGKPLLSDTGKSSGKAVTDGVAANDSKPAGVSLVNGMIAGVNSRQGALTSAVLAVVKSAIAGARPEVGGQSLGVALDQGIAVGISSSASIVATAASAAVTAAKTAASNTAGHKSPATLFIPLGESISEGIAMGITNKTSVVATAASNAVKGALTSLQTSAKGPALSLGLSAAPMPAGMNLSGLQSGVPTMHSGSTYNVTVQGNADANTVKMIQNALTQHDNELLQKSRSR